MGYRLLPYTADWEPAAARSNSRFIQSGQAPFLLPEKSGPASGLLQQQHYLAVDDANEVRGGCLLQFRQAWAGGETAGVVNIQSPLSEGLFDRRFIGLGPWMIRELLRQHPLAYCVGMGSEQMPFPRLLRALGWRVEPVPFLFRVLAGRQFLANMQPIRRHPRFGPFALAGGAVPLLPDVAFALLHAWRAAEREPEPAAAPVHWDRIRARYSFAAERTPAVLDLLYPPSDPAFVRVSVPGGLAILRVSEFRRHAYFGDLTVATLAETLCQPAAARGLLRTALAAARGRSAGLLLANHSDPEIQQAMRSEGWLSHASNYLVGLSPQLAARTAGQPYYVTRGDGDGLLNL